MEESQRCNMHWVSERWLGGTLTNYHTIRRRLKRLEELEKLEADGSIEQYSKKAVSRLRRERRKILRNLEGIRKMKGVPGCLVVVDVRREHIAVAEARKMGLPVVGLVDTDCDPGEVDLPIPGNDDAYRSIQVVLRILADAVILGRKNYDRKQAELAKAEADEKARKDAEAKARAEAAQKKREADAAAAASAASAAAAAKPAAPAAPAAAAPTPAAPSAPAAPAAPAPAAPAAPGPAAPAAPSSAEASSPAPESPSS